MFYKLHRTLTSVFYHFSRFHLLHFFDGVCLSSVQRNSSTARRQCRLGIHFSWNHIFPRAALEMLSDYALRIDGVSNRHRLLLAGSDDARPTRSWLLLVDVVEDIFG